MHYRYWVQAERLTSVTDGDPRGYYQHFPRVQVASSQVTFLHQRDHQRRNSTTLYSRSRIHRNEVFPTMQVILAVLEPPSLEQFLGRSHHPWLVLKAIHNSDNSPYLQGLASHNGYT